MSTRRVESFLLRIVVPEDQALTPECWRGRIQHIASGSELQIDQLAEAVAFIANHLSLHTEFILEGEAECPPLLP